MGRLYFKHHGWFRTAVVMIMQSVNLITTEIFILNGTNRQLNHTGAYVAYNLPTTNWNLLDLTDQSEFRIHGVYGCFIAALNLRFIFAGMDSYSSFHQTIRSGSCLHR